MTSTELTPNPNRLEIDDAYMQMAGIWAQRSKSNRTQVGCLIVKNTRIISDGYNGLPSGAAPDVCEDVINGQLVTKAEVIHAESNAIAKISKFGGEGLDGSTLYVTMSPCKECAKLIIQSGISRVVYRDVYRDTGGLDLLVKYKIPVEQLPGEENAE